MIDSFCFDAILFFPFFHLHLFSCCTKTVIFYFQTKQLHFSVSFWLPHFVVCSFEIRCSNSEASRTAATVSQRYRLNLRRLTLNFREADCHIGLSSAGGGSLLLLWLLKLTKLSFNWIHFKASFFSY